MVPGSVGFQCPECVARGARETRQFQLPYGGERSNDPKRTTFVLIAINVLVWLALLVTGGSASPLLSYLALIPEGYCVLPGGEYIHPDPAYCASAGVPWAGITSMPWQAITSGFTHVQAFHIASNMFVLYMLGPIIEQILGRARFLAIYFVALLGGSALAVLFSDFGDSHIGASGAIYGLLGATALIAFKHKGDFRRMMTWIGVGLVLSFVNISISWQGHLGGLLFGLAATAAIIYLPRAKRNLQWPLLGSLAVLAVVLLVVGVLL